MTAIFLILGGAIISIGVFKFGKRKSSDPSEKEAKKIEEDRILDKEIQAWWLNVISPLERFLARHRLNPNVVTLISFGFSLTGCIFFHVGWLFLGGWVVLFAGTMDILDGRIARKTGLVSRQGAFFDSVMDRYGEVLLFLGLAAHFRNSNLFYVILLAMAGSLLVSYTRARAEGLGVSCTIGIMQRPERVVILGFGAIFSSILHMLRGTLSIDMGPYLMWFVLGVIALLANATAISRMIYVMRQLREEKSPEKSPNP
jgi:phosphatidylglycerophosphate synthase